MINSKSSSEVKILVTIASLVTIAATPFVNKDALIIPKVIVLFAGTLYLLPRMFLKLRETKTNRTKLMPTITVALILFQLLLVNLMSDSPLSQQIFGRTGRGIGLITLSSSFLILLMGVFFVKVTNLILILYGLTINLLFVSIYSISQSFGYDFFAWDSKTNGVIGTLGNPNFVSSLLAMAFLPALTLLKIRKCRRIYMYLFTSLIVFAVYRADSLQGYFGLLVSVSTFTLIWIWHKNRYTFFISLGLVILGFLILIFSSLNIGPFSRYFYKISVQSRGDFWRSAVNASADHKFFGVGLDSFGDYYLKYRDLVALSHPWGEFTDSAHNYFLDFLVSGGYPLLLLYIFLNILIAMSFFKLISKSSTFNPVISSLLSAYLVFLAQSLISPISIPLLVWSLLISGAILGVSSRSFTEKQSQNPKDFKLKKSIRAIEIIFLSTGLIITYPYFNSDKLQFTAMKTGDGDLAILSAKMYPESVIRYSIMTRELLNSGLNLQALDLARAAVAFNPNSPALWALILINPMAPVNERLTAKERMLALDPLNQDVLNFEIF